MSARDSLGFTLATRTLGVGQMRTVARFQCLECGTCIDKPVTCGKPLDPEGYSKWANARGWVTRPFRKSGTCCPKCAGPKRSNDTDSELRKVVPMTQPAPPSAPIIARELTPDERMKVRNLLDKHFDDGPGAYLDGMSDRRIGEIAGVPRINVERMREASYGPIRLDPEIASARAEVAALKKEVEGIQKMLVKLNERLMTVSSGLEKKAAAA